MVTKTPKKQSPSKKETKKISAVKGKDKSNVVQSFQKHGKDTGSSFVQIAILTKKIDELTDHLKTHKKDNHSRYGLLKMVGKRKKQMSYLKASKPVEYAKLISELGLRR